MSTACGRDLRRRPQLLQNEHILRQNVAQAPAAGARHLFATVGSYASTGRRA
jgi:hypothetical protein